MRGMITGAVAFLALAVSGCTTDGTDTETPETNTASTKPAINYTAWACEGFKRTVKGGNCDGFHSAYGPGRQGVRRHVQSICPGNCEIIFVKRGCVPLALNNRQVLRPKCET